MSTPIHIQISTVSGWSLKLEQINLLPDSDVNLEYPQFQDPFLNTPPIEESKGMDIILWKFNEGLVEQS